MEKKLTQREQRALNREKKGIRTDYDTKHSHVGGWQNFDMEAFLKGRKKTYTTKKTEDEKIS
jgi:hypothetical protein